MEPERGDEFARVSEARRAAWAWRRYVTAVREAATVELRYESLVDDAAERLPEVLGVPVGEAFAGFRPDSIGRWRNDLSPEQVQDVEDEAGTLLAELGYT